MRLQQKWAPQHFLLLPTASLGVEPTDYTEGNEDQEGNTHSTQEEPAHPKRSAEDKGLKQKVTWSLAAQQIRKNALYKEMSGCIWTERGFYFLSLNSFELSKTQQILAYGRLCRAHFTWRWVRSEEARARRGWQGPQPAGSEAEFTREVLIKKNNPKFWLLKNLSLNNEATQLCPRSRVWTGEDEGRETANGSRGKRGFHQSDIDNSRQPQPEGS